MLPQTASKLTHPQEGWLPPADHGARRARARDLLRDAAPWMLITNPLHVRYLTGFAGTNGQLFLGPTADQDRFITDERYEERAGVEVPELPVVLDRDPFAAASRLLREQGTRVERAALAVEADHLTWMAGERIRSRAAEVGVEVVPTTGAIVQLRECKDDAELARLARACAITQDALEWLVTEVVAVGRTERELAVALERRFIDLGADGVAFASIVAGGPHSAIPHHAPTGRPLERGDLLTIDCGALVDGYHADHTRTYAVGGIADELAAVHDLVVRAQAAGRAALQAGATAGAVDAAARDVIDAAGYGERFVHGTGHGVGLEIHEAPAVAKGAGATLGIGTALTVEPGVYLPGTGGVRIEDTLVITADGTAHPLTDTPRELRVL